MNYYEFSRRMDVFDSKEFRLYKSLVGICTPAYHRYMAARWLAWYRVFYRNGNTYYRKEQVRYFINELKSIQF